MKPLITTLLAILWLASSHAATLSSDGSQSSTQSAIDRAANGDTINVAFGNHSWASPLVINKAIHLSGGGSTIVNAAGSGPIMVITPDQSGHVEISDFHFTQGGNTGSGRYHLIVEPAAGRAVLIHDCQFDNAAFGFRDIEWRTNGGVIYNCVFTSVNRQDTSGIAFKNPQPSSSWQTASTVGTADSDGEHNTYLEDCTFKDVYLQALDLDDNSRTVVRHCKFDNSGITSHGWDTSPQGTRQWEIYDNEFVFTGGGDPPNPYPLNLNYWFYVRGGTGVMFGNVIPAIQSQYWGSKGSINLTVYNIRRRTSSPGCQTSYPAARQFGFGCDNQGRLVSEPVYFWNNSGSGAANIGLVNYDPDECGNNQQISNYIRLNRDYFTSAKPGYQPYTYPHPLRADKAKPTPTPAPSATPTPNPTVAPTPTPPADGTTYRQWLDQLGQWVHDHPATPDQ